MRLVNFSTAGVDLRLINFLTIGVDAYETG
jgi:hypothetical protein